METLGDPATDRYIKWEVQRNFKEPWISVAGRQVGHHKGSLSHKVETEDCDEPGPICIHLRQLEAFNADIANSLVNEASGGDVRKPLDLQDHCPGQ